MQESAASVVKLDITEDVDHRAVRNHLLEAIRLSQVEKVTNLLKVLPKSGDMIHAVMLPNHPCLLRMSGNISNEQMHKWLDSDKDGVSALEKERRRREFESAATVNFIIAAAAGGRSPNDLIH